MSDTYPLQQEDDEAMVVAFLGYLSGRLGLNNLKTELPADVITFAESRDLSSIDVNEFIRGPVEI